MLYLNVKHQANLLVSVNSFRYNCHLTIGGFYFSNPLFRGFLLTVSYCSLKEQLPMRIPQHSLIISICRRFLQYFFIWVLFVRSFFMTDMSYKICVALIPMINCLFIYLSNLYPGQVSGFTATWFFIFIGIQLLTYDEMGSRISHHILNSSDPILSVTSLIILKNKPIFTRYGSTSTFFFNAFIGKTAMSATGRATLIGGAFTGGAWLYNEHLNRRAMDQRAQMDRDAANQRAQDDRDAVNQRAQMDRDAVNQRVRDDRHFAAWKIRHEAWVQVHQKWQSSMFKKGPEPKEPIYDGPIK